MPYMGLAPGGNFESVIIPYKEIKPLINKESPRWADAGGCMLRKGRWEHEIDFKASYGVIFANLLAFNLCLFRWHIHMN